MFSIIFSLGLLIALFLLFLALGRDLSNSKHGYESLFLFPCMIMVFSYFFGHLNNPIYVSVIYWFLFILSLGLILWRLINHGISPFQHIWATTFFVISGTLPVVPALLHIGRSGQIFGLASLGNNDLGVYSLHIEQFSRSNLFGPSFLGNGKLYLTRTGYFGFTSIGRFIKTLTGLNSYQATYITLMLSASLLAVSLYIFLNCIFPEINKKWSFAIVLICSTYPLQSYLLDHGFGGQILGLSGVILMLESLFVVIKSSPNSRQYPLNGLYGFIVAVFSYQPFVLVAVPISLLTHSIYFLFSKKDKRASKELWINGLFTISVFILLIPIILNDIEVAKFLSGVQAGWSLHLGDFGRLFFPQISTSGLFILTSFLIIIFFLKISIKEWSMGNWVGRFFNFLPLLSIVFYSIFALILRQRFGSWSEYHVWKGISYFLPILIVLVAGKLLLNARRVSTILILLGLFINVGVVSKLWEHNFADRVLISSFDIEQLSNNVLIGKISSLNVNLNPYMESAIASATVGTQIVYINQPTTAFPNPRDTEIARDSSTCTLTRVEYLKNKIPKGSIRLGKSLILIPIPNACRSF